jgi:hypothetical protein
VCVCVCVCFGTICKREWSPSRSPLKGCCIRVFCGFWSSFDRGFERLCVGVSGRIRCCRHGGRVEEKLLASVLRLVQPSSFLAACGRHVQCHQCRTSFNKLFASSLVDPSPLCSPRSTPAVCASSNQCVRSSPLCCALVQAVFPR